MRSSDIKNIVTQMSLDHNVKVARAVRNVANSIGTQLAESGVPPVVSPTRANVKGGYSLNLNHGADVVRDSTTSKKIANAHRDVARKLASKTEVTKMMGS